jgi:flagellar biosynthetic protein FliQ
LNDTAIIGIAAQALLLTAKLAGPILIASVVVGLLVSVLQAVVSVQEQSLSFVPKLAVTGLILLVGGHWMIGQLTGFVYGLYAQIPHLLAGG